MSPKGDGENKGENPVIHSLKGLNAPLGTSVSFLPMFGARSVKTAPIFTEGGQRKVKTEMGWISARHMRTGGSLNRNPSKQRKGPLRKIIAELVPSTGIFDPAWVELECGHKVRSHGQFRARCDECGAAAE